MNTVIIGFGNIAIKHLEVAKHLGIDVIASSNRSSKGNELAKQHGIAKTYINYIEMIENEKPDSIIVCVSFEHLFPVCKSLIPFNIPILLEKPAGTSLDELRLLIESAKKFGTKVQVAMNRRHYNNIQKAIEHAGGWSQITAVDVEWSETPIKLLEQKGYTHEQVAKIIFGNSIHGIDLATFFGGEIESPTIITHSFGNPFRWYMQFSGKSKEGKLVSFRSSWDHPVPWKLVLSSKGKRYVFAPLETCKVYYTNQSTVEEIEINVVEKELKTGFVSQMKSFKNLVELPKFENIHNLESCIPAMEIAERFYKALNN